MKYTKEDTTNIFSNETSQNLLNNLLNYIEQENPQNDLSFN